MDESLVTVGPVAGTTEILAPIVFGDDLALSPFEFVAKTLATTKLSKDKLHGNVIRLLIGISQKVLDPEPPQLVVSSLKVESSLCLTSMR